MSRLIFTSRRTNLLHFLYRWVEYLIIAFILISAIAATALPVFIIYYIVKG
jgi:hypothetical protein